MGYAERIVIGGTEIPGRHGQGWGVQLHHDRPNKATVDLANEGWRFNSAVKLGDDLTIEYGPEGGTVEEIFSGRVSAKPDRGPLGQQTLTVSATAEDAGMAAKVEPRTIEEKTAGGVLEQIAGAHGLELDSDVQGDEIAGGALPITVTESDYAVVKRVARAMGASASVQGGKLIVRKLGDGPVLKIGPKACSWNLPGGVPREAPTESHVYYYDQATGEEVGPLAITSDLAEIDSSHLQAVEGQPHRITANSGLTSPETFGASELRRITDRASLGTITCRGRAAVLDGVQVELVDFGPHTGVYWVRTAQHSRKGNDVPRMTLTLGHDLSSSKGGSS